MKKGGNATGVHEVDGISGGTITSKAVETMIADYLKCYRTILKTNTIMSDKEHYFQLRTESCCSVP